MKLLMTYNSDLDHVFRLHMHKIVILFKSYSNIYQNIIPNFWKNIVHSLKMKLVSGFNINVCVPVAGYNIYENMFMHAPKLNMISKQSH